QLSGLPRRPSLASLGSVWRTGTGDGWGGHGVWPWQVSEQWTGAGGVEDRKRTDRLRVLGMPCCWPVLMVRLEGGRVECVCVCVSVCLCVCVCVCVCVCCCDYRRRAVTLNEGTVLTRQVCGRVVS